MSWILSYGCTTATGFGVPSLFDALVIGRDCRSDIDTRTWPAAHVAISAVSPSVRALCWPDSSGTPKLTQRERMARQILRSWSEARNGLSESACARIESREQNSENRSRLGVILASTKGFVDDFIWLEDEAERETFMKSDALRPVLDDFLNETGLQADRSVVVSNACASSLSAIALARSWLLSGEVDDVILIAGDVVGPFVVRGFESLRVLTKDQIRPFADNRTGFHLGEASAAIVISRHPERHRETPDAILHTNAAKRSTESIYIRGAGIDAEGFAVTRPSEFGESLRRACLMIPRLLEDPPDVIVAHGTATIVNDQTEDEVYAKLFGEAASNSNSTDSKPPWITGAKWCVGHTLGASGAIDVIAAAEALRRQTIFRLMNTEKVTDGFKGRYLTQTNGVESPTSIRKIMMSSLGFGGVHAAVLLEMHEDFSA